MKAWAAQYEWAANQRDQIINNAKAWPSKYLSDYNLSKPELPPSGSGGIGDALYLCPDNTKAVYVPKHSPPHFCASTGQYFATPPQWPQWPALYDQIIFEYRHFALAEYAMFLGLAYQLTNNTTYANGAAYILRSYAALYPTYPPHTDPTTTWKRAAGRATDGTLTEARWIIQLAWAYDLIADSDLLTPSDRTAISDGLFRPAFAKIKENDHSPTNWQAWHDAALAIIALVLGDEAQFRDAFNNPKYGFYALLDQGAAADGFWWEGSWGYHFFTLNAFIYLAEMGTRAGLDPYANAYLRAMFSAPLQIAMPDLTLPPFNDSGVVSLGTNSWMYDVGCNHYRDPDLLLVAKSRSWQSLLWGTESLPVSNATALPSSVLFPQAGYAILRAGSDDPRYIALDFGPHGGWHGHYDKLGYISAGSGGILGTDPGTHLYSLPLHDSWDRTTVAHNTVVVDEINQTETTGQLRRFLGLPALSLATATAGSAYPNRATIERTLILNDDYWLDVTRAATLDRNPHSYDWVYHNPGIILSSLPLAPYSAFPKDNGYNHLANTRAATSGADWQATWDSAGYGSIWVNTNSVKASFTITDAVASNGSLSGQVNYDFSATTDGYALYYTRNLDNIPTEVPSRISVRVYGDNSYNDLTLRIMDATSEKFIKNWGRINWTGWRTIELPVDSTWSHQMGNDNGIIDTPISQVVIQVAQRGSGTRSGRLFVDEITLTFPAAGKLVVEDFENALARVRMMMLGSPNTTIVIGDGFDAQNQTIPFAMARRQGTEITFTAVFEPYRTSPRISTFQALSVAPAVGSPTVLRVAAPNYFNDTLLLADEGARADRTFGTFSTDAPVAYARYDAKDNLQTLVLGNATKLSNGAQSLFASTVPITLQVSYEGNTLAITTQTVLAAQLRVHMPLAIKVMVNGNTVTLRREGEYVLLDIANK
jgi:hypothetical protein